MLSRIKLKLLQTLSPRLRLAAKDFRTDSSPNRRRSKSPAFQAKKADEKSEWWIVDGEMHEIGDHVPPRERFVIPRDNIPNKRRKQLREQFMRRTRLVLKESEHEPWCKRYMELYQELRENWERLYWDEGYSKKIAQDHANYESAEDDDQDFNPYRPAMLHCFHHISLKVSARVLGSHVMGFDWKSLSHLKFCLYCRSRQSEQMKDQGPRRNRQGDTWEKVSQIRDKFEYDREKRMREKAFAPMNRGMELPDPNFQNQPLDARRYFPGERD
ncbi:uncharacterized protein LOC8259687 isoform X1 [Ricinus communis]|uniref:uncharacterized protein LOC8259687 isoform X1 n=1 Tax=Ricinus communis TaxID=3988 RepID=UPI00201AFCDE|nr:uncharacterized protein LOC8259687 isoform X1 [Ricinus communis]